VQAAAAAQGSTAKADTTLAELDEQLGLVSQPTEQSDQVLQSFEQSESMPQLTEQPEQSKLPQANVQSSEVVAQSSTSPVPWHATSVPDHGTEQHASKTDDDPEPDEQLEHESPRTKQSPGIAAQTAPDSVPQHATDAHKPAQHASQSHDDDMLFMTQDFVMEEPTVRRAVNAKPADAVDADPTPDADTGSNAALGSKSVGPKYSGLASIRPGTVASRRSHFSFSDAAKKGIPDAELAANSQTGVASSSKVGRGSTAGWAKQQAGTSGVTQPQTAAMAHQSGVASSQGHKAQQTARFDWQTVKGKRTQGRSQPADGPVNSTGAPSSRSIQAEPALDSQKEKKHAPNRKKRVKTTAKKQAAKKQLAKS